MKILLTICFTVICIVTACAQSNQMPKLTFDHLALSVKDVDRSTAFYKSVLHLDEIPTPDPTAGVKLTRWISLGEGKQLHLISILKEPVTVNKAVHLALTAPDFEAILKELDANKIAYSDFAGALGKINLRKDGIKQVYFQDPDGYWIELNSVGQKRGTSEIKKQNKSMAHKHSIKK